ncbi:hypothetical protein Q4Q35_05055 [Flavivirga aquimarina]|uniref:Outer membrane protein beta-barrel domain-containing protein n=1 Tax=Flavivirga aquimarina TaxID=2027862 RepID=A0ABT8W7R6_9FLAO|nr:hypothetical protein [Flavivirga aquimarina]MDO5969170.1 hypothetical protein [Flavivirga aquimarina]
MKKQLTLLVVIMTCFVTTGYAQKGNYRISNGIGINAAITNFNITTNNFITSQGNGFMGGFSTMVDIPHRFYNVSFGMQISQNNIDISARPSMLSNSDPNAFIEYKMLAAQVALLGHIKLIKNYVTIDLGPMLQYNGTLELKDKSQANYYINNYSNLLASDISNISQFNINGTIGASAGYKFIRLKAQYIYGFTNILRKLNSQDVDSSGGNSSFKGNQNMLVFGVLFLL